MNNKALTLITTGALIGITASAIIIYKNKKRKRKEDLVDYYDTPFDDYNYYEYEYEYE